MTALSAAADVELLSERIDDAIRRLVDYVRRSSEEDHDVARRYVAPRT